MSNTRYPETRVRHVEEIVFDFELEDPTLAIIDPYILKVASTKMT